MTACQFGICRRPAEVEITVRADVDALLVCGLHITPILTWGLAEPHEPELIRPLHQRGQSAA
jgi:hypothetical protein